MRRSLITIVVLICLWAVIQTALKSRVTTEIPAAITADVGLESTKRELQSSLVPSELEPVDPETRKVFEEHVLLLRSILDEQAQAPLEE